MDDALRALVWRGILDANPWWTTGRIPHQRTAIFHRHAFETIYTAFVESKPGRGVVVLGPRRIGKTVLLHQVAERLVRETGDPAAVCLLTLDDVALRGRDLGELLALLESRRPQREGSSRYLLIDEIQHSPEWSGWLKRITDRRDPYVFLATGSSATALRRGGQDAGLGRWREIMLYPWSFREHVELRRLPTWNFAWMDRANALAAERRPRSIEALRSLHRDLGPTPDDEADALDGALVDYLLRGGFPEAAVADDLAEARRRLRQDILDRALGRDVVDEMGADTRALERMFLRVCMDPGGLWNETTVANDLGLSRPTVARYLRILEGAFLVFQLPNLGSPIKGRSKVYLVAPAMRQALLGLDEEAVRRPDEWGRLAENAVAASLMGSTPDAHQIGFWRRADEECDGVVLRPGDRSEYLEVKRSGERAKRCITRAAGALQHRGHGSILTSKHEGRVLSVEHPHLEYIVQNSVASWLYGQRDAAGGTLRFRTT